MELPESWQWKRIRDIVDLASLEKVDPRKWDDGEFNYIDIASVDNQAKTINKVTITSNQEAPSRARQRVEHGDILVSTVRPNLNAVAVVDNSLKGELVCSTGFAILRINPDYAIREYLFNWVTSDFFVTEISNKARGASYPAVSSNDVLDLKIPIPPLEEQQVIVEILQQAEQLRRLRQDSLAKAEKLAAALFLEMFGDPIANTKNWQMKRLSDVVKSLDGGKNVAEASTNTEYKILKVSAVTYGSFMPSESKYLPDDYQFPDSYLVKKGDLLISRANTSELIGATAYVWDTPNNILLSDKIWRFVWKENVFIEPLFVFYLTKTKSFRSLISQQSTGTSSSMKNIAKPKLLSLPIPLPPIERQEAFAESLKKIEVQRKSLQSQLDKIETFLTFLQSQAFSGKLTETWRQKHSDITSSHVKVNVPTTTTTTAKAVNIAYAVSKPRVADYREIGLVNQLSQYQKTVWSYFVHNEGYVPDDLPTLIAELPDEITANDQTRLQTTLATLTALGLIVKVSLLDSEGHYTTAYRAVREDDQLDAFKLPPNAVTLI